MNFNFSMTIIIIIRWPVRGWIASSEQDVDYIVLGIWQFPGCNIHMPYDLRGGCHY